MLTVHLNCPLCRRSLRCQRLIAPGERLRCPHCRGVFQAGIDEPVRNPEPGKQAVRSALAGWLLFATFLLLAGGGFGIAVAVTSRAPREETPAPSPNEPELAITSNPVPSDRIEPPAPPSPVVPEPTVPARKSSPPPAPLPPPPDEKPKPPPLPAPPRREPQPTKPRTEKPADPEKLHAPASSRPDTENLHWLPPHIQKQVDRSIDGGIEFLRRQQRADGSWGHQTGVAGKRFTPGITALSGLTLLECGVPAQDSQVRLTARYLRQRMPELTTTYSISLAILFFDRLGEDADAARIRTLALRLMAGQKPSGGWDYYCPKLTEDEELGLLALLYKDRPTNPLDLFARERPKESGLEGELQRDSAKLDTELYRPRPSKAPPLKLFVTQGSGEPNSKPDAAPSAEEQPAPEIKPEKPARPTTADAGLPGDSRRLTKRALEAADKLPEALRRTPALRAAELLREPPDFSGPRTDNSNTQFAILGLLTAENYDVPMERAMTLLDWRFRNSMTLQGSWNYRLNVQPTPSMTAAALMGLALKHGLLLPNRRNRGRDVTVHDDEIIHRGFLALTGMLEHYYAGFVFHQAHLDKLDLYCLWTVERVAVLYNQQTLGDLQWYPAGVQLLLPLQREDGSWGPGGTTCLKEPSVATSFALLFLKRSNLARELTKRLKNE